MAFNGLPGVTRKEDEALPAEMTAQLLTSNKPRIGIEEIKKAGDILAKYKEGKANLESRIVEDELWWELRHWEAIKKDSNNPQPRPTSAWLFNSILNKHADAMDNMPEPLILPRERSDEESAKVLSSVLPVVLENNDFEQVYSLNWWEKLKHGTSAYGVFWNSDKENGLGDIDITSIDLLKLFWEPGITDLQKSKNLFILELVDVDDLEAQYPEYKGKLKGNTIDVKEYNYDDTVDTSNKSVVVDWYYKVKSPDGRTLLHYAKFVGDCLLFASENEPEYEGRGWYDHGQYPVVLDVMFPEKGTPIGFGYVAICKDPQLYIDKLSANILENAMMATKKRYFVSENTAVNEDEFLDWNNPLVRVQGELDDRRIKEIENAPLPGIYVDVLQYKIEEMKDTAANRDVNSGGAGSGVTAAAAIAALQEAGNKTSRDMIATSYRAYVDIDSMCIELMRQFYTEHRAFRVTGDVPGTYEFIDVSNSGIAEQEIGVDSMGVPIFRKPIFDIKIKAQKRNPFSRMEQNERAKELYGMGFFNPERAQEALGALDMMEFEGVDKVRESVSQGQTLMNIVQQMSAQMDQMAMMLQALTGKDMGIMGGAKPTAQPMPNAQPMPTNNKAPGAPTPYAQALAKRSSPNRDNISSAAMPE